MSEECKSSPAQLQILTDRAIAGLPRWIQRSHLPAVGQTITVEGVECIVESVTVTPPDQELEVNITVRRKA